MYELLRYSAFNHRVLPIFSYVRLLINEANVHDALEGHVFYLLHFELLLGDEVNED